MEGKTSDVGDNTTPPAEVRSCPSVRAASFMNLSYSFPPLADMLPSITAPIAVNNGEVSIIFSSLFPTIKFDCYLTIMPYILSASEQAWKCLESYMPPSGPIVARDLGLLLAYLMFVFDIRRMTTQTL
ncbi:hypothetical protein RIF29_39165 [Crotalaria pallida]|uniref:Uncharacterized protein n=1 Tax=Crotalaria pallida TaxID=3830 RepID=A0AAN9E625_CROPI